ncbi:hypothetical protein FGO68_gene3753 [Halteria grandinella]|uniref:Histidine kinase n=1 Tax=Halteria grandinella TaxID=5974 RepID=A0A8J8P0P4_HALGN|nr:hypothetical protein FGO68_gene3753 [Halteria grandinella]
MGSNNNARFESAQEEDQDISNRSALFSLQDAIQSEEGLSFQIVAPFISAKNGLQGRYSNSKRRDKSLKQLPQSILTETMDQNLNSARGKQNLLDSFRSSSPLKQENKQEASPQLQEIVAFKQQEITFQNAKHDLIIIKSITHFVAYEQLKMQNHFLEMLTATISHDMRTPLNAILGMGVNLKKYIEHPQGIKFHSILINSSQLLLFLVNDFLDLFRFKNGKFQKNESFTNFRQQIEELIEIFKIQAEQKGLILHFDCDPNVPEEITIDLQRVKQVLINLIGNSLKFTFKGSIVISARVVQDNPAIQGHELEIKVCDTGVGIKDEDKVQIFQMFGKLESTAQINTSGIGLGVSICKMIVEALDGSLYLTNGCDSKYCLQRKVNSCSERPGTTFGFRIRLRDEDFSDQKAHINLSLDQIHLENRLDSGSLWHQVVDTNLTGLTHHPRRLNDQFKQGQFESDKQTLVKLVQRYKRRSEPKKENGFIRQRLPCPCKDRRDILVVDDNVFNLITLQSILHETLKVDSDSAMNGQQAIERVKERQLEQLERPCKCGKGRSNYKFIFMDCNMPVMDGLQATGIIKRLVPEIFIAALTAYTTEGFEYKCLQAGMDDYLTKPITRERILNLKELSNIASSV